MSPSIHRLPRTHTQGVTNPNSASSLYAARQGARHRIAVITNHIQSTSGLASPLIYFRLVAIIHSSSKGRASRLVSRTCTAIGEDRSE